MPALVVILVIAAIVIVEFIAFWRRVRDDGDPCDMPEIGD